MKKIQSIIHLAFIVILLSACSSNKDSEIYLDRPDDTNLEFWITQKVDLKEFEDKGCTYLPGRFGADEYLDSRYTADINDGMAVAPAIHVKYLVTGYPDLVDELAVTHIEITDPSITVYGLNMNSTDNEILNRINNLTNSFSYVTTQEECYLRFTVNNCSFCFMSEKIVIDATVTNNTDVVF